MAGESYATAAQLGEFLVRAGETLEADRLLKRATELVQEHTFGRIAVPDDPDDIPADPAAITHEEAGQIACRKAACAQVEYWLEVGEDPDLRPNVSSYNSGRISTSFANGGLPELCPRARRILFVAGALYAGASTAATNSVAAEFFSGS